MIEQIFTFILAMIAITVTVVACLFMYGFILGFIKWKRKGTQVKKFEDLNEEQKKKVMDMINADEKNWLNLALEKHGEMIYFYDNDTKKFLFQCKTFEEMVDELEKIRGHRGVRISAESVADKGLQEFFSRTEVKAMAVKRKPNESV